MKAPLNQQAQLLDLARDPLIVHSIEGTITFWNHAAEDVYGFNRQETLGKVSHDLLRTTFPIPLSEINAQLHSQGEWQGELIQTCMNGKRLVVNARWVLERNAENTPVAVLEINYNVIELGCSQDIQRQSELGSRLPEEAFTDCGVYLLDRDGNIMSWNPGAERMKGFSAKEIIGQHYSCFHLEEDIKKGNPQEELSLAASTGSFHGEGWRLKKDGSHQWVEVFINALHDGSGNLIGFSKLTRDLTERKQAEEALAERARLAAFVAAVATCLIRATDERAMVGECTKLMVQHLDVAFARIWILNKQEQILELQASSGMYTDLDGLHSRIPVGGKLKVGIIAQKGKPILSNDVCNDPYIGDKDWARQEGMVSFAGYPLLVGSEVIGVVAMFARRPLSHVTLEALSLVVDNIVLGLERLRATSQQKASEARFRLLVEAAPNGMLMVDENDKIVLVNSQIERLFGYSRAELYRQGAELLMPENAKARHIQQRAAFRANPQVITVGTDRDLYGLRKDGSTVLLEIGLIPLLVEGKQFVLASLIDITERRQAQDELRKANEQLEIRVRERTSELLSLNKELSAARDDAQAASRIKSEFLANMSHEIRTPMNSVIGMANVLLKTELNDQQYHYANVLKTAGHDLLKIINNILDFSKIEAGKIEISAVDFDLIRVVDGTCELFVTEACARQLPLMTFIDPFIPHQVHGDPERIQQILMNLVSNAIKFSSSGGIMVRAEIESIAGRTLNVRFSVSDHGIGLTASEKQRLFQPFVQADGSISRKFGGTGLGLSICKRLVELMGGRIGVTSSKGEGSTFWFSVPLEDRSRADSISMRAELKGMRLLIVDPVPESCAILETYTGAWGMRFCSVTTARAALFLLRQAYSDADPFRIVIISQALLDGNGLDLGREIFSNKDFSETKLILLSVFESPGFGTLVMDAGFEDYLTKPVTQARLLRSIMKVLGAGRSEATQPPRGAYSRKVTKNALILVVDDHAANQQVLQLYLDELGFASVIANNGREAIEAIARNRYALVLMDCQMPELDGFATAQEIRKAEGSTDERLPIIAVTAHAMEGDRERCLAAGMDDYISKPIDPDELRQVLEKWLPDDLTAATKFTETEQAAPACQPAVEEPVALETRRSRYKIQTEYLLDTFIKDASEQIEILKQVLDAKDSTRLVECAHGLKGICGSMSAHQMQEICRELEAAGRLEDWTGAAAIVKELDLEFALTGGVRPDVSHIEPEPVQQLAKEIRILLVEDQQVTRLGSRMSLHSFGGLRIIGEASNGVAALELTRELNPDVILMDIGLPGIDGIEVARKIKASQPEVRILMFTARDHEDEVLGALAAGADGYCLKESSVERVVAAINAVSEGAAWLDPAIARHALAACVRTDARPSKSVRQAKKGLRATLSNRELKILRLIVDGLSNKQIAERLGITLDTVKSHVKYILSKLAVTDRTQAAVKALQDGLLQGQSEE